MTQPLYESQVEWQAMMLDGLGAPYAAAVDLIHHLPPEDVQDMFTPFQFCKNQLVALYTWCDLGGRIYEPSNVPPIKDRRYPYATVWCSEPKPLVWSGMGEVIGYWDTTAEVTIIQEFTTGGSSKNYFRGNLGALRMALAGYCEQPVLDDGGHLMGYVMESTTAGEIDMVDADGNRQVRHNGLRLTIQFS